MDKATIDQKTKPGFWQKHLIKYICGKWILLDFFYLQISDITFLHYAVK